MPPPWCRKKRSPSPFSSFSICSISYLPLLERIFTFRPTLPIISHSSCSLPPVTPRLLSCKSSAMPRLFTLSSPLLLHCPPPFLSPLLGTPTWYSPNFRKRYKFVLIGNPDVGKTSFFHRFASDLWLADHQEDTDELCVTQVRTIEAGGKKVMIDLWDTAGQEKYRTVRYPFSLTFVNFLIITFIPHKSKIVILFTHYEFNYISLVSDYIQFLPALCWRTFAI